MAKVSVNNSGGVDLAGFSSLDTALNSFSNELMFLPEPSIRSLRSTQITGKWGGWKLLINGSGLTGRSPVANFLSLTTSNEFLKIRGKYALYGGGVISSISMRLSGVQASLTGSMKFSSGFDFLGGSLKNSSISYGGYKASFTGSMILNSNFDITGGRITSFTFSDPNGYRLSVSNISFSAVLFDNLVDPDIHSDLTALISALDLSGNDQITGGVSNDIFESRAGNDTLDGGGGADTMIGGAGNDVYSINSNGDVITELADEGSDTINININVTNGSYSLPDHVENGFLANSVVFNLAGNLLNNTLIGNAAANVLAGDEGNDTLNGGLGADSLVGGIGDDTYVIDNAGDVVTELVSEGTDTVRASFNYTLGDHLENLALTGKARNGTGNAENNYLSGNSAVNTLRGMGGNDTLNGGAGADLLIGGTGDDVYIVDNVLDRVSEGIGEGTDEIRTSLSYSLLDTDGKGVSGGNVENLTLTGSRSINATGNALDNVLIGNAANNVLNGRQGADTMQGGAGNDTYYVDNVDDAITETANGGTDNVQSGVSYTLASEVENLTLLGAANITGSGNDQNNLLRGNSGNNILNGKGGNDTLTGGAGSDTFVFDTDQTNNFDTITDFTHGLDSIQLDPTIFPATTGISTGMFMSGTGLTIATNSNVRIIYNTSSGILYYDEDGQNGSAAIAFARLSNKPIVTLSDFKLSTGYIYSDISYAMSGSEVGLILKGTDAITGTGNSRDNVLLGNVANNALSGEGGNDTISGGDGSDTLTGGTGNDVLDGGASSDVYLINSSNEHLQAEIADTGLEGTDEIRFTSTTSGNTLSLFTGDTGIESVIIGSADGSNSATTALNIDASAFISSLTITGNNGNNYLVGTQEDDLINAADGDDYAFGSGGGDVLTGGNGNDTLIGGVGHDTLEGGGGVDILAGGAGSDVYIVDSSSDVLIEELVLTINRATTALAGGPANGESSLNNNPASSLSSDGRYLVFSSSANNLVADDKNGKSDIFVKDLQTGETRIISTSASGQQANGHSFNPTFSPGGRYVLFESEAYNLTVNDPYSSKDIYLKDLETGEIEVVSTNSAGEKGNGYSFNPFFSWDGQSIIFISSATNLVQPGVNYTTYYTKNLATGTTELYSYELPGITTGSDPASAYNITTTANGQYAVFDTQENVYLKNITTGEYRLVSKSALGTPGNNWSYQPHASSDGRFVVFKSYADNLVESDTNGSLDFFVKDMQTDAIQRISTNAFGMQVNSPINNTFDTAAISADGRYITFASSAKGLTENDVDGVRDIFVIENPLLIDPTGDGGGIDAVYSSVSYSLPDFVENITLTGTDSDAAMGNNLDNIVTGNGANNVLQGLEGADLLFGNAGDDTLVGGIGADVLTGGDGLDIFVYESTDEASIGQAWDVIADFVEGDLIDLSVIDADLNQDDIQAFEFIGVDSMFSNVAGQLRFDSVTHMLSGDINGNGSADFNIELTGVTSLSGTNFKL